MAAADALKRETARLLRMFESAGASPVEVDVLQPASTLLDLYGEDIRARAYVTSDPVRGELMLRPDFTVPVAQMHLASGTGPSTYAYAGLVFRRQLPGSDRPSEFMQVGCESFGGDDSEEADAEIFALMKDAVADLGLTAVSGDLGVLLAAVESLSTTPARKAALKRHIWRPSRFKSLVESYCGKVSIQPSAAAIRPGSISEAERIVAAAGSQIGLRSASEVVERLMQKSDEADADPLDPEEANALESLFRIRGDAISALASLRRVQNRLPGIESAADRFERRIAALKAAGADTGALEFEATYGRTTLEYYNGFVFGFVNGSGGPDLPPVASGGRYDFLTRQLGGEAAPRAVGGVVRPEIALSLAGGL